MDDKFCHGKNVTNASFSIPLATTPSLAPSSEVLSTQQPVLLVVQCALVTSDCLFDEDYPYAIDTHWSCGDEQFDKPLRLHTWKRHSHSHQRIFADQLVTYRENGGLWFDAYSIPRCIQVIGQELFVTAAAEACSTFGFLPNMDSNSYRIQQASTGRCMGLGTDATCESDRSTGGSECGGVDHRFLPLVMMEDCDSMALAFRLETKAQECNNNEDELPRNSCFAT
jgi:hypothetical protein